MILRLAALVLIAGAASAAAAAAAEPPSGTDITVALTLKDHRFTPDRVSVPAGRKVRIELANRDAATEEFDSDDLRVEKDVTPHGKASFTVGPLQPGTYAFMGELHADTATGAIVAVATQSDRSGGD